MENRNFYIISILILLLIGLFMIPITGLLIDPAPEPNYLDTPLEELNGYSLRQVYENDLYIDDSLSVLNNHTLREVFEGGNLVVNGDFSLDTNSDGLADNWSIGPYVLSNHRILDNMQYWTGTTSSSASRLEQIFTPPLINSSIYVNVTTINVKSMRMYWGDQYLLQYIQDEKNSSITILSSSDFRGIYFEPRTANVESGVKNVYFINLSSFGISSLTLSQMDYFFNLYQGILASAVFGNYINEFGIYANGSYINDMTTFGLENMSLSKHNYYYDLYQYYSSFEN